MNLIKHAKQKITFPHYKINLIAVVTLLSTLLLTRLWPRFLNDSQEFPIYGYVILIVLASIFLFKK